MIYDPEHWGPIEEESLVSRIAAEIDAVCGTEVLGSLDNVEELAKAVDRFLKQERGSTADTQTMMMLASQALSSLGEKQAARKLLVLGTGLVSPAEWAVSGEESVWVIDLKQITVRSDDSLEIVFFMVLNMVLECIAEVWDKSGGRGTLGLRHVCGTAMALLGSKKKNKNASALAEEIMSACRDKLAHIGARRHWKRVPQVMNLDI